MGVINITPDSFSDGGKHLEQDSLNHLNKSAFDILDIGAESTAPFNEPITEEEEWRRFEQFFFDRISLKAISSSLSFDTYRFETFLKCYEKARKNFTGKIYFNDISGKLEKEYLSEFKKLKNVAWVYSHNLCPVREKSSFHMDYCSEGNDEDFLTAFNNYFTNAKTLLSDIDFCFDPCFGFSKTRQQNQLLIKNAERWLTKDIPWLIGLSRKSFLRFPEGPIGDDQERLLSAELIHFHLLVNLSQYSQNIIFRIHNSTIRSSFLNLAHF